MQERMHARIQLDLVCLRHRKGLVPISVQLTSAYHQHVQALELYCRITQRDVRACLDFHIVPVIKKYTNHFARLSVVNDVAFIPGVGSAQMFACALFFATPRQANHKQTCNAMPLFESTRRRSRCHPGGAVSSALFG